MCDFVYLGYVGDFNSHAHVERDYILEIQSCIHKISTHTLTWSVTVLNLSGVPTPKNFNSHAHVERDQSTGS